MDPGIYQRECLWRSKPTSPRKLLNCLLHTRVNQSETGWARVLGGVCARQGRVRAVLEPRPAPLPGPARRGQVTGRASAISALWTCLGDLKTGKRETMTHAPAWPPSRLVQAGHGAAQVPGNRAQANLTAAHLESGLACLPPGAFQTEGGRPWHGFPVWPWQWPRRLTLGFHLCRVFLDYLRDIGHTHTNFLLPRHDLGLYFLICVIVQFFKNFWCHFSLLFN